MANLPETHGFALSLSSVHSSSSSGLGDLFDLHSICDLAVHCGMQLVQLLPLNDTGSERSPYSAQSSFAIHPVYLSVNHLLPQEDMNALLAANETLSQLFTELKHLNLTNRVSFSKVVETKDKFMRLFFQLQSGSEAAGSSTTVESSSPADDRAFNDFCKKQKHWIDGFAVYKALKKEFGLDKSWETWPSSFSSYSQYQKWASSVSSRDDRSRLDRITEEVSYQKKLQFECFKQLIDARKYADSVSVHLKGASLQLLSVFQISRPSHIFPQNALNKSTGDLPFLISRDSADVWQHPESFILTHSTGAPPDMYAADGQNWGMPPWNFEQVKADKYILLKQRLQYAQLFFSMFRLDHIVGFYRTFEIPVGHSAREGSYNPPALPEALKRGEEIMKFVKKNTTMIAVGEDLGAVPVEVKQSLQALGILGTKVLRWERDWDGDGHYLDPKSFPKMTMTTVSTHDSETLEQWWSKGDEEVLIYVATKGWSYNGKRWKLVKKFKDEKGEDVMEQESEKEDKTEEQPKKKGRRGSISAATAPAPLPAFEKRQTRSAARSSGRGSPMETEITASSSAASKKEEKREERPFTWIAVPESGSLQAAGSSALEKIEPKSSASRMPLRYRNSILRDSHTSGSLLHINLLQEYFPLVAPRIKRRKSIAAAKGKEEAETTSRKRKTEKEAYESSSGSEMEVDSDLEDRGKAKMLGKLQIEEESDPGYASDEEDEADAASNMTLLQGHMPVHEAEVQRHLSWPDPEMERINVPGVDLPTNWTYRMRPSLEHLLSNSRLHHAIKAVLQ